MKTVCLYQTFVSAYEAKRRHHPEQRRLQRSENLKSHLSSTNEPVNIYDVNKADWHLYSEGVLFDSWPGNRLTWLKIFPFIF